MGATEIILGMIFIIVAGTILDGGIKNIGRPATEMTISEFERNKARCFAYLCPVIGLLVTGSVLYRGQNEPAFDYLGLSIGVGIILYGLYKRSKLRSNPVGHKN